MQLCAAEKNSNKQEIKVLLMIASKKINNGIIE